MAPKDFDPLQLSITLGTHIATGFAADTLLSVEMDSPLYNTEVDAHGNSYRYKINNYNATITLTLNQGSPTNDILSTFANLDRQSGIGVFPLTIKDNNSDSLYSTLGAYVEQIPTAAFGTTGNNREWVIKATNVGFFIGGTN